MSRVDKRKGATVFGTVAPNLNVVNVLTPPTTVMEGFTNHLVESDYTLYLSRPQTDSSVRGLNRIFYDGFPRTLHTT